MSVSQESDWVRRISAIHRENISISELPPESEARDNNLNKLREGYDAVEDSDTQWINWRVWAIAGSGLFLGSYNLVAINSIFPSTAFSYWKSDLLRDYGAAIDIVTLLGSTIGPIVLGYLADKHGRRAVYGWELLLTLFGAWNLVISSHSKNPTGIMLVWMTTWRLVLGIGVGSGYPLSAVITAESTPTKSRARTMAAVFLVQPLGELAAHLTALATLWFYERQKGPFRGSDSVSTLSMDDIWRDVILIGALPALGALALRSNYLASARYAVIEISTEGVIDHMNTLDKEPFSVQSVKKAIFTYGKWSLLLSVSATWLLLDLLCHEVNAITRNFLDQSLDWSVCTVVQPNNFVARIPAYNAIKDLVESALAISIRGVLPAIFMTATLEFVLPAFFISLLILPINAMVYLLRISGSTDHKFVFHVIEATIQMLYNLVPNVITFIISAETCPARYRTTCYAITTMCGKLGSKTLQIIGCYYDGNIDWFWYLHIIYIFAVLSLATLIRKSPALNKMRKSYLYLCCVNFCSLLMPVLRGFLISVWDNPWLTLYPLFWIYYKISRALSSYQLPTYSPVSSLFWPKIPEGCERVSWKCECGVQLYGDFRISSRSQEERLHAFLTQSTRLADNNTSETGTTSIADSTSSSATANSSGSSSPQKSTSKLARGKKGSKKGSTRRESLLEDQRRSSSPLPERQVNKYLALCVNTGRFHTTLGEINVTSISQDNEVFRAIKQRYLEIRGVRARARRLFLVRPISVQFVKFNVEDSYRADILLKPSIPPKEEVLIGRYEYAPLDLPLPPITTNSFLHYMTNPACSSLSRTNKWLGCLPKRLRDQLGAQRLAVDPNRNVTGWGIHIEEGLNEVAVAVIGLSILLISGVVGIIYSQVMRDVSGGFGIAGYIVGVLTGVVTLLHFMWQYG